MGIIRRLNEGATKDESIQGIPSPVINYYQSGKPHAWKGYLEYITFAWRCFYYSWDFTSALHNAAKCPANRHLAMVLTGAFAEAMYGCTYSMTKKKFGGHYEFIDFPVSIPSVYKSKLNEIRRYEYKNRVIFKKNDALSNVERQTWTDIANPLESYPINAELRRRIMKAYNTGYEHRYGVYLDNGRFYVYRSHRLLYRFQLKSIKSGEWHITNLQKSDDNLGEIQNVYDILETVESWWYSNIASTQPYSVSDEIGSELMNHCKYFRGETQCPLKYKDSIASKFWYGEKMFVESELNLQEWMKHGDEVRKNLDDDKRTIANKYSRENFGILLYIESLFSKLSPYDNIGWIFKY